MHVPKAILKHYLEQRYGDTIDKEGDEWVLPSLVKPSKKKLYVNVETGVAIDFIGNEGYNARTLIGAIEGLRGSDLDSYLTDLTFRLMSKLNVRELFEGSKAAKHEPPPVSRIDLPPTVDILGDTFAAKRARNYLFKRGVTEKDIRRHHLSFCYEGHFANRIIIPFIENGVIVWFQARSIDPNAFLRYDNPQGVAKSMLVYNLDALKEVAVITEGPFDAIRVNGQAVMGSALSDWQAVKILGKHPQKVIIVPDNDKKGKVAPGYVGALKSIETLIGQGFPMKEIYVAKVEGGKDLADMPREKAVETVLAARPFGFATLVEFRMNGAESKLLDKLV